MQKTLDEILKESESGNVKNVVSQFAEYIKQQEEADRKMNPFAKEVSALSEKLDSLESSFSKAIENISSTLQEIKSRPDPKFPEQQPYPEKMTMDRPDWYESQDHEKSAMLVHLLIAPLIEGLTKQLSSNHEDIKGISMDILNKESIQEAKPATPAKQNVKGFPTNSGVGSIRRRARWEVVSTKKGTITGNFDGINTIFYLPSAVIPNSETVKLNGATPLANGEDYTVAGNKITFMVAPVAGSTCEIRYQN